MSESQEEQLLQPYSVDQLAGAVVLCLGAIGSLLLVIWQSRCLCRCRIGFSDSCYIFDCSREPPPPEEKEDKKGKKDQAKQQGQKGKVDRNSKELDRTKSPGEGEPEPEPEPILPPQNP